MKTSTQIKSFSRVHVSLNEDCISILRKWSPNTTGSYILNDFIFRCRNGNWEISETCYPTHVVYVNETAAARVAYALSCNADNDVIAESLNLR